MKGCIELKTTPEVSQEVFEKNKVNMEEIHDAVKEIYKRRSEDNKSRFVKLFERIFKKGGE